MKPFNAIIVGMTGCGKTYFLLKYLESFGDQDKFENIFLICPTFDYNETYLKWKHLMDPGFIVLCIEHDQIEDTLKYVVNYAKGTRSLIILDDCAASQIVKNRTSELIKLGFGARHFNLSTIVITQQLTSIAKPYRENISFLVCFFLGNKKDLRVVFDEYLNLTKPEEDQVKKQLKENKFSYLKVNLVFPYEYEIIKPKEKPEEIKNESENISKRAPTSD